MVANNSLLNGKRFFPLFGIQFLNALNDHILRNAILVMITYEGMVFSGISREISVNIASLLFILPFFICSAYAGKFADTYSKVFLIRIIKLCEIGIVLLAAIAFFSHSFILSVISLAMMGIHSSFFGPIKYSILPHYFDNNKALILANGYIELGTFIAILAGQMLGSWYMGQHHLGVVILLMAGSTLIGLGLSFRLENVKPLPGTSPIKWNILAQTVLTYKKVTQYKPIKHNIHALSWFWALGLIYTTQLPIFTGQYLGGNAQVFSILLGIFSVSIGIGSVICAKLSNGQIKKHYVIYGALGQSIFTLVLLGLNYQVKVTELGVYAFSSHYINYFSYLLIFLIGFSAGFYSVTCYNELQIISPLPILSQVIAVNNILNAAYMLVAAIVCTALLILINVWELVLIAVLVNFIFIYIYWRLNYRIPKPSLSN